MGKKDLRENIFLPGGGAGLAEKFKGVKERYVSAEARFGANKGAKLADPMHGVPDDVLVMVLYGVPCGEGTKICTRSSEVIVITLPVSC